LFESILRQDMAFFDKSNPGELNSVLTNNLETLKGVINFKFSDCLTQVGKGIACIIFALVTAWKFTLPFLTIVPFMVISLNLMIHYIKKYSIQEFLSYGSAGKIAQETLSSLRTTISFGIHHKAIKEYGIQLKSAEKVSIKKGYLKGFFEGAFNGLLNLMFGIGIYYATILYRTDCKNYYPGNLMPAFFCLVTSSVGLGQGFPFLTDVGTATGVAKKIFDYIKLKSSIDIMKTEGKIKLDQIKGDISLKNVFFSYPQRPDVKIMQGLNLDIPAGKTVAFCGARYVSILVEMRYSVIMQLIKI
jgi:ABC-type multidrug transport system fused ATPase/permease subunit